MRQNPAVFGLEISATHIFLTACLPNGKDASVPQSLSSISRTKNWSRGYSLPNLSHVTSKIVYDLTRLTAIQTYGVEARRFVNIRDLRNVIQISHRDLKRCSDSVTAS